MFKIFVYQLTMSTASLLNYGIDWQEVEDMFAKWTNLSPGYSSLDLDPRMDQWGLPNESFATRGQSCSLLGKYYFICCYTALSTSFPVWFPKASWKHRIMKTQVTSIKRVIKPIGNKVIWTVAYKNSLLSSSISSELLLPRIQHCDSRWLDIWV